MEVISMSTLASVDVSGQSDNLTCRFPVAKPTPSNSIRYCSPPIIASHHLPLPDPGFNRKIFNYMWQSPPIYIDNTNILSVDQEIEFMGPCWRIIINSLNFAIPLSTRFRLGTRIVYKGADRDDVSYFVIGHRLTCPAFCFVDVFAYNRGDMTQVTGGTLWPPFTLAVPHFAMDRNMINPNKALDWLKDINSDTPDEDVERGGDAEELGHGYINAIFGYMCSALCM